MKKLCIALTGGMGCGKSIASKAFADLGVHIEDADKLAHKALNQSPKVREEICQLFGDVYTNGCADRKAIAKQVFADRNKLEALEKILHPAVEEMWQQQADKHDILIVEVPLLYEKRLESKFDLCICVYCSDELRRNRLSQRGMTAEEISARDAFQIQPKQKAMLADIVLFNESSTEFLKMQAARILSRLTK